jgi:hypothetical protein
MDSFHWRLAPGLLMVVGVIDIRVDVHVGIIMMLIIKMRIIMMVVAVIVMAPLAAGDSHHGG